MSKGTKIKNFCWNKEEKTVLGRTGWSWGEIICFYFFYYSFLVAFFSMTVAFFYSTTDSMKPRLTGMASILNNQPGMSFRPYFRGYGNLITYFDKEGPNSTQNKEITNSILKEMQWRGRQIFSHGHCQHHNAFGYTVETGSGGPCVLMKLNKIYGFMPKVSKTKPKGLELGEITKYKDENGYEMFLKPSYKNDQLWVQCNGKTAYDRENMGTIGYMPQQGFPLDHFPYNNTPEYQTPYVFVYLMGLVENTVVQIECEVFAENIKVDKQYRVGTNSFFIVRMTKKK